MKGMILAAWRYRHFILSSIRNDFRSRFARSKLGGAWMILHPLTQVLMYAVVLSAVLSAKLPGIDNRFAYAIYLTAGMLAWSLFSETVTRCLTIFIDNGNLLKKMAFPRICLPLIVGGSSLVNNLLLLLTIVIIFAFLGHPPTSELLWMPILTVAALALGMGVGLVLGVLNVFMRDIGQIVPVLLQFSFWFTPIVYPKSIVPENYLPLLQLNPLYHLVSAYQDVLVFHESVKIENLGVVLILSFVFLLVALVLFRKSGPEMVDVL